MLLDLEIYFLKITFKYIYFYFDHLCMCAHVSACILNRAQERALGPWGCSYRGCESCKNPIWVLEPTPEQQALFSCLSSPKG